MKELRQHAEKNNLSIAQVIMANEMAVSGKSEERDQRVPRQDRGRDAGDGEGRASPCKEGVLPGPIKLHSKAATVFERAQDDKYESDRAIALVSAFALAASEENARGHLVITAPTGGSAGVMPAIVYALVEEQAEGADGEDPRGPAGRRWPSAICASTTPRSAGGRRRLPVRDRRRLGDGRRVHRPGSWTARRR